MKAISLWQPWASLWLSPRKIHETRHWQTAHFGWMAVHASKKFIKDHPPELAALLRAEFGAEWYRTLPTGAILGAVKVITCTPTEDIGPSSFQNFEACTQDRLCGNFDNGRYGWRRSDVIVLPTPIPYRGMQGMFNISDKLIQVPA